MWLATASSLPLGILSISLFGLPLVYSQQNSQQIYLQATSNPSRSFSNDADSTKESVVNFDAHAETDNLVFTTIASLLQQWPNTRFRNGHTIARGTIPVGTVLYHGRRDQNIPLMPEWLATNVEHSYLLCPPPECWMLTFTVVEELNVVYFDGSSAANAIFGHQDSQDLVIWGEVRPDKVWAERERINQLCNWGDEFGIDATVRMEPGFEVMLCDFNKKLKLISSIRIMAATHRRPNLDITGEMNSESTPIDQLHYRQVMRESRHQHRGFGDTEESNPGLRDPAGQPGPPGLPKPPHREPDSQPLPPGWSGPLRDNFSVAREGIQAAAWNSFYPGEARVKVDYTRLISFYDPSYASLIEARRVLTSIGKGREWHRLWNISTEDYGTAMQQLEEDLSREDGNTSGIDWSTITRTVLDRYADRLRFLQISLSPDEHSDSSEHRLQNSTAIALAVREHLMVILMPYLLYGAVPSVPSFASPDGARDTRNTSWVEPIRYHCATTLTSHINPESLTRSERMIKTATEGVLNRICSTLTLIWVDALSVTDRAASEEGQPKLAELVKVWKGQLDGLMEWLDWPMWDTCRPACSEQMFCYISTWPWGVPWGASNPDEIDMTPRCIDRSHGLV